ncbi:PP0621 family protein [Azoarcus sp. KH32C]|uniref:PP0621 family protein n=1 Tax=Azoarcus sp. KH32C TaxID=748247 RepID=UPI00023861AF|nr:PP0621 family protein [Azoarcus sp. KH32C]BAL26211.1 hypothetical protein AZKH_3927 [Azoarcus sp. KH32C]
MRNLLIFILILVAIWWVRRIVSRSDDSAHRGGGGARRRDADDVERMVGCAHCGVHVPESECVRDGETFYCSEEHRRLGARR